MSKPKLCLFDEPSISLAPLHVTELSIIHGLRDQGIAVLIEQDVRQSLETANCAHLLEGGRMALERSSQELLEEEHIRKANLRL